MTYHRARRAPRESASREFFDVFLDLTPPTLTPPTLVFLDLTPLCGCLWIDVGLCLCRCSLMNFYVFKMIYRDLDRSKLIKIDLD